MASAASDVDPAPVEASAAEANAPLPRVRDILKAARRAPVTPLARGSVVGKAVIDAPVTEMSAQPIDAGGHALVYRGWDTARQEAVILVEFYPNWLDSRVTNKASGYKKAAARFRSIAAAAGRRHGVPVASARCLGMTFAVIPADSSGEAIQGLFDAAADAGEPAGSPPLTPRQVLVAALRVTAGLFLLELASPHRSSPTGAVALALILGIHVSIYLSICLAAQASWRVRFLGMIGAGGLVWAATTALPPDGPVAFASGAASVTHMARPPLLANLPQPLPIETPRPIAIIETWLEFSATVGTAAYSLPQTARMLILPIATASALALFAVIQWLAGPGPPPPERRPRRSPDHRWLRRILLEAATATLTVTGAWALAAYLYGLIWSGPINWLAAIGVFDAGQQCWAHLVDRSLLILLNLMLWGILGHYVATALRMLERDWAPAIAWGAALTLGLLSALPDVATSRSSYLFCPLDALDDYVWATNYAYFELLFGLKIAYPWLLATMVCIVASMQSSDAERARA